MSWKIRYHNLCLKCEVYDRLNTLRKDGEDNSSFIQRIYDILTKKVNKVCNNENK